MADHFTTTLLPDDFLLVAHVGDASYGPGPAIKALDNCVSIMEAYALLGKLLPKDFSILLIVSDLKEKAAMEKIYPSLVTRFTTLANYMNITRIYCVPTPILRELESELEPELESEKEIKKLLRAKPSIITIGFDHLSLIPEKMRSELYYCLDIDAIVWCKVSIFQRSAIARILPVHRQIIEHVPPIRQITGNDSFYNEVIDKCGKGKVPPINKIYLSNPSMWYLDYQYSITEILLTIIYTFPNSEIHILPVDKDLQEYTEKVSLLKIILGSSKKQEILAIAEQMPAPQSSLTVNLRAEMMNNILIIAEGIGTSEDALIKGSLIVPMIEYEDGYGLDDEYSVQPKTRFVLATKESGFHLPEDENQIVLHQTDQQKITVYWKKNDEVIKKDLDLATSERLLQLITEQSIKEQGKLTTEIAILCGTIPRLMFKRHKDDSFQRQLCNLFRNRLFDKDKQPLTELEEKLLLECLEGIKPQFLLQLKDHALATKSIRMRLQEIASQEKYVGDKNLFLSDISRLPIPCMQAQKLKPSS